MKHLNIKNLRLQKIVYMLLVLEILLTAARIILMIFTYTSIGQIIVVSLEIAIGALLHLCVFIFANAKFSLSKLEKVLISKGIISEEDFNCTECGFKIISHEEKCSNCGQAV